MLSRIDRLFVQQVREARSIGITVNRGASDEMTLCFDTRQCDIKKLPHDIAIAIQEHLSKYGKSE